MKPRGPTLEIGDLWYDHFMQTPHPALRCRFSGWRALWASPRSTTTSRCCWRWATPTASTAGRTGFVAVATQVGYAVGMLAFVPLGDVLERRALMMRMYAAVAVALLLVAVAPELSTG